MHLEISYVILIEPNVFGDECGYFLKALIKQLAMKFDLFKTITQNRMA